MSALSPSTESLLRCKYFDAGSCRSCSQLGTLEGQQGKQKFDRLRDLMLGTFGAQVKVTALFQPRQLYPSRAKAKLAVTGTLAEPVLGLVDAHGRGQDLLDCALTLPVLNRIARTLRALIQEAKLTPYDIQTRRGELKYLLLSTNQAQSEVMLRFVVRSTEAVPRIKKRLTDLQQVHPELRVCSVNIQPKPAAILEGPQEIFLTEQGCIHESYASAKVLFAPQTFMQVTPEVASALYAAASDMLGSALYASALDLFCGVGGFSFSLRERVAQLVGVELSPAAIACAQAVTALNSFPAASFVAADALQYLRSQPAQKFELIVTNPPRRGLGREIVAELQRLEPKTILYSSCNPETLVADLRQLGSGYLLHECRPFDMFPLTDHLEVLARIERRG